MAKRSKRQDAASEHGLEELNLVEFPLGLLTRDRPEGINTLVFRDQIEDRETGKRLERSITIASSSAAGLPNCFDQDVLLALLKLTNDRNGFSKRELQFSIYELRKILGIPSNNGGYSEVLIDSLKRLVGMTVEFKNAWRSGGKWRSLSQFHILDNMALTNTEECFDADVPQHIKWNDVIVENILALNAKKLDWDFYLSLKTPLVKRLYRFLDKRFGQGPAEWSFDLETLCHQKIGMLPSVRLEDGKKQVKKAIADLVRRGYLAELDEPFERVRKGVWRVTFRRRRKQNKLARVQTEEPRVTSPIDELLRSRGVTNAAKLAREYSEELIRNQVENFDDRNRQGEKLGAGWLRKAIEEGYGFRKGFRPKAELEARQKETDARNAQEAARNDLKDKKKKEAEQRDRESLSAFLEQLKASGEYEAFKADALRLHPFQAKMRREAYSEEWATMYLQSALENHWKNTARRAE